MEVTGAHSNFAVLRKLSIYIILIVLALYNTPLYELCKVPALIRHFQAHHQKDRSVGFGEFLSMHYLGNDDDDNDDEEDRRLPFKEANGFVLHQLFTAGSKSFSIQKPAVDLVLSYPIEDHSLLPTPHLADLFRPPQV